MLRLCAWSIHFWRRAPASTIHLLSTSNAVAYSVRKSGGKVAHAHLRWLNPFPKNLGDVLRSYDRVLVPEMNLGQLLKLVRAEFLVDAVGYNRVRGKPFKGEEIKEAIEAML